MRLLYVQWTSNEEMVRVERQTSGDEKVHALSFKVVVVAIVAVVVVVRKEKCTSSGFQVRDQERTYLLRRKIEGKT